MYARFPDEETTSKAAFEEAEERWHRAAKRAEERAMKLPATTLAGLAANARLALVSEEGAVSQSELLWILLHELIAVADWGGHPHYGRLIRRTGHGRIRAIGADECGASARAGRATGGEGDRTAGRAVAHSKWARPPRPWGSVGAGARLRGPFETLDPMGETPDLPMQCADLAE